MTQTKTTATQIGRDTTEKLRESMSTNEFAKRATDAAYTIVGLGVMGAQKATAATKQATKQFGSDAPGTKLDFDAILSKTKDATAAAVRSLSKADGVVEGALSRIEDAFAPIEEFLPDAARETVQKFRGAGKEIHAQVRSKVNEITPTADAPTTDAPSTTSKKRSEPSSS
jgi:mannitol-1-phosphate/altronate dehydrogenase